MAPIESSQRALSIGAIGFGRGHVLNHKMVLPEAMISIEKWIDNDFPNSNQIKSWENGRQIKSNHEVQKKRQIKSNRIM